MKAKFFTDLRVASPAILDENVEKIVVNTLVTRLSLDEFFIICAVYGIQTEPKTIAVIRDALLFTTIRVSRIRDTAMRKIRWHAVRTPLMKAISNYIAEQSLLPA